MNFVDRYEPLIELVMKNSLTSNMFFACLITCYCSTATAQYSTKSNTVADHQVERKMEHYRILKEQGYKDQEIFEDLGNANFLNENYAAASFWYEKLKESKKGAENGTTEMEKMLEIQRLKQLAKD